VGNPRVGQPVHDLRQILKPDVVIGGKQGSSLNLASLTPKRLFQKPGEVLVFPGFSTPGPIFEIVSKPLASSVYVHVLEAPPPLKRSISVTFPFPSPNQDKIIIGDFQIGSRWSDPQVHGSHPSSRAMPHSAQGPSEGRSERTIGESLRERPISTKRFTFLPHFLGDSSRRIGAVFLSPSAH